MGAVDTWIYEKMAPLVNTLICLSYLVTTNLLQHYEQFRIDKFDNSSIFSVFLQNSIYYFTELVYFVEKI